MTALRERAWTALMMGALFAIGGFLVLQRRVLPERAWGDATALFCFAFACWPLADALRARRAPSGRCLSKLPARPGEVYLGRGHVWTLACTRALREAARTGPIPALRESRDLFLRVDDLAQHTLILGTTGSGKTRLLELLIAQAIRRGDAVAVIDPKGDERLFARVAAEGADAGRAVRVVALPYPRASVPYNPLAEFADPREVADRVAAALPSRGDAEPFRNFAWEVVHATAAAMHDLGLPMTLAALKRYALDDPGALVRKATPAELLRGRDLRKAAELAAREAGPGVRSLVSLALRPAEHTQKMTSALLPLLSMLTAGTHGALLSPERGGFSWSELDRAGGVGFFFLGSLLGADSAGAVAKMALLDFQAFVGRRYAYGARSRAWSLFVDEVADVLSPAFLHTLNKCRGADVRVTLVAQTLADLEGPLGGPAGARQLLGNVNTVVQFRAQSIADAESFSELAGERLLPGMSEAEAYEPAFFTSGRPHAEDFRAIFSRHRVWRDERLVPAWAVAELPTFHFFARSGAGLTRGRVPLLPPASLAPLEALRREAA